MKLPVLGTIDERFLFHRLKSTSIAGVTVGALATLAFAYRYYIHHVWDWELLGVGVTFVVVKLSVLAWYRLKE